MRLKSSFVKTLLLLILSAFGYGCTVGSQNQVRASFDTQSGLVYNEQGKDFDTTVKKLSKKKLKKHKTSEAERIIRYCEFFNYFSTNNMYREEIHLLKKILECMPKDLSARAAIYDRLSELYTYHLHDFIAADKYHDILDLMLEDKQAFLGHRSSFMHPKRFLTGYFTMDSSGEKLVSTLNAEDFDYIKRLQFISYKRSIAQRFQYMRTFRLHARTPPLLNKAVLVGILDEINGIEDYNADEKLYYKVKTVFDYAMSRTKIPILYKQLISANKPIQFVSNRQKVEYYYYLSKINLQLGYAEKALNMMHEAKSAEESNVAEIDREAKQKMLAITNVLSGYASVLSLKKKELALSLLLNTAGLLLAQQVSGRNLSDMSDALGKSIGESASDLIEFNAIRNDILEIKQVLMSEADQSLAIVDKAVFNMARYFTPVDLSRHLHRLYSGPQK